MAFIERWSYYTDSTVYLYFTRMFSIYNELWLMCSEVCIKLGGWRGVKLPTVKLNSPPILSAVMLSVVVGFFFVDKLNLVTDLDC